MVIFEVERLVTLAVSLILVGVKAYAVVNAITWRADAYAAADKLSKTAWCTILAIGLLAQIVLISLSPVHLLQIIFTIATFVYLCDVRPAMARLTGI